MNDTRVKIVNGRVPSPTIMERLRETDEPSSTALFGATAVLNEDQGHMVALEQWARDNASTLRRHEAFPVIDAESVYTRFAQAMFELGVAAYTGGTPAVADD